jgi:hypothetical protein
VVPYKVYVVVGREFGEKLSELEDGVPVWIVETPTSDSSRVRQRRNVEGLLRERSLKLKAADIFAGSVIVPVHWSHVSKNDGASTVQDESDRNAFVRKVSGHLLASEINGDVQLTLL